MSMRRSVRISGWLLGAAFLAAGCGDVQYTFQGNTGATISALSPSAGTAGGPSFTLTVFGVSLQNNSVVRWNGQNLPSTLVSTGPQAGLALTATVPQSDIATPGTALVDTLTPQSGAGNNGLSNTLTFTIWSMPAITSLSPPQTPAGSGSFTLTIVGSNFVAPSNSGPGSSVNWKGPSGACYSGSPQCAPLTPTSVSSTQIAVTIPASLVATAGTAIVTVSNPGPVGGTTPNGLPFTICSGACPASASAAQAASLLSSADSPAISQDGRFVALVSSGAGHTQVYVQDTCAGADKSCQEKTTLVTANSSGDPADGDSRGPAVSQDGRYIAFDSDAKDLAQPAPSGRQVFLRDTCAGAPASCQPSTVLVSDDPAVLAGNDNISPTISASGRFVAFVSVTPAQGGNSAPGQMNSGLRQVFVRDTCLGAASCTPRTIRVSLHPGDTAAPGGAARPAISGDGQRVALPVPVSNVFTPLLAIDERVFLALIASSR
jgi:hypothetical protein